MVTKPPKYWQTKFEKTVTILPPVDKPGNEKEAAGLNI
jgi:hypothetical protein